MKKYHHIIHIINKIHHYLSHHQTMFQHVGCLHRPPAFLFIIIVAFLNLFTVNASIIKSKIINSPVEVTSVKLLNYNDFHMKSIGSIQSFNLGNYKLVVEVIGSGLQNVDNYRWSLEKNNCDDDKNTLDIIWINDKGDKALFGLSKNSYFEVTTVYFCLTNNNKQMEAGNNVGREFILKNDDIRSRRDINYDGIEHQTSSGSFDDIRIEALRVEMADKDPSFTEEGIPEILEGTNAVIRLFGHGITINTSVTFTDASQARGTVCDKIKSAEFVVQNVDNHSAIINVKLPLGSPFYVCVKDSGYSAINNEEGLYKHQGTESYKMIKTYAKVLPQWLQIVIILVCLLFSALFSGLNLGLMSMDHTELKILCNTGTETEKKYARTIQPVRNHGNYLLCSILFSNVLVNSIFTILLDDLTSGLVAVICSTIAIVIFGEISPQAFCSRHGLCVGAKTILITKATMWITFPLSYPISKFLDCMLGEEIGNVYNRERLKELVKVTTGFNDLEKDEVNIIAGALELRKKTVADIMTRIEDVYMLDYNAVLDFETVSEIMKSGFSRIPVYEGARNNIITMLYIKDLAFVDPDDNTPLKTLCQFYQNPCNFVFEDVTLDVMFKQFKEGYKGHMAFVQRVNNEGEGDPFYEVIGLVTLEDVIEELIQAEIMDETDVFTDNRSKRKRLTTRPKMPDFTLFAEKKDSQRIHISPQLTLAMFQYLSTTVPPFKPDTISETILRRLLKQDIINHIKVKSREKARNDAGAIIYQQGKPVDYFVLILEGRVEVTVGKENLTFESGPFTYFGCQALSPNIGVVVESPTINVNPQTLGSIQSINLDAMLRHTFVPDYTVRAITEVFYVKVKRSLYLAAKRATLLERSQKDPSPSHDQFDDEVEKLLHSLDEDDHSTPPSPILSANSDDIKLSEITQRSPIHNTTAPTSPLPVSASPITNSKFIPPKSGPNGQIKTSPVRMSEIIGSIDGESKLDLDAEIMARQAEAARILAEKKTNVVDEEEKTHLLSKQDRS
ncbi:hypothetical protein PV328_011201 [Microctonus aethiopoides]|uniref:Metal transporter CNNM2 n=1 Tax=Microctonus aethiopoides TaxID=144406 RepID=A0AA39C423_9HYME|nr:hypothetical protein PV328_011201 [Microctonus aethiopoides]